MNKNDKVRNVILIVLAICLIGITVAYASLSQNLNISGLSKVSKSEWNIHFTNLQTPIVEGYASGGKAVLNGENTVITVSEGILKAPGDKIVYTFDVINEGDLPAEVELTTTQMESCRAEDNSDVTSYCDKIDLDLVYSETKEKVQKNDRLLVGETKTLSLIITYDKDKLLTSLPTSPITLSNITSIINYTMLAKENSEVPEQPISKAICKRVSSENDLHNSPLGKFGQVGTTGTLMSGDAFDCDVNGDGNYSERFYYVTDLEDNNDIAIMIYYINTVNGEASNNYLIEYDGRYSLNSLAENWHGPVTARSYLPTTEQWSNISLTNNIRAIKNEAGGNIAGFSSSTLPTDFSYEGYAARFLTTQEVSRACGISEITDEIYNELLACEYLMENTKYQSTSLLPEGYWLETPKSGPYGAWIVDYISRNVTSSNTLNKYGVRPVIEVSKIKIDY